MWEVAPFAHCNGCPSLGPPACSKTTRAGTTFSLVLLCTRKQNFIFSPQSEGHSLPRWMPFSLMTFHAEVCRCQGWAELPAGYCLGSSAKAAAAGGPASSREESSEEAAPSSLLSCYLREHSCGGLLLITAEGVSQPRVPPPDTRGGAARHRGLWLVLPCLSRVLILYPALGCCSCVSALLASD